MSSRKNYEDAAIMTRSLAVGQLLVSVPSPDEPPLSFTDGCKVLVQHGGGLSMVAAEALLPTFLDLLRSFGLAVNTDDNSISAVSDDACTFLRSIGELLKGGLPLLGDWRARGATQPAQQHRQLIALLEKYRIERQGDHAPATRRVNAVAAVIKGQLEGDHYYLLQHNPNWNLDWWIGGIVEKSDVSPEHALYREIEEELGLSPSAIKSVLPFTEIIYTRVSSRIHAKTEYRTRFFEVTLNESNTPMELFRESSQFTTMDLTGREFIRLNTWQRWDQFCSQKGFETKGSDVAAQLVQKGIQRLNSPHAVLGMREAHTQSIIGQPENRWGSAQISEMLNDLNGVSIQESTVVGEYLKHDQTVRNSLKDWASHIRAPLLKKSLQEMNFLIWAASGSGKSFLIQQIAEEIKHVLKEDFQFIECNLAKDSKEEFVSKVGAVANASVPVLCLLDEIDNREDELWPYEECFGKLELNTRAEMQVVFVLIGSSKGSLSNMVEAIKRRHKGPDLLNRILQDHNCFSIPSADPEDVVVMVASQIRKYAGPHVKSIEKLALHYILCNESLKSPKQLREFVKSASARMLLTDDRLRFYHLFRPEDDNKKYLFRRANESLIEALVERDIRIS